MDYDSIEKGQNTFNMAARATHSDSRLFLIHMSPRYRLSSLDSKFKVDFQALQKHAYSNI